MTNTEAAQLLRKIIDQIRYVTVDTEHLVLDGSVEITSEEFEHLKRMGVEVV